MTWGRDLIKLFFPKMTADILYFSFLPSTLVVALCAHSCHSPIIKKKNKATSVYRLEYGMPPHYFIPSEVSILATTWFVTRHVWTWILTLFCSNVSKQVARFCCYFNNAALTKDIPPEKDLEETLETNQPLFLHKP